MGLSLIILVVSGVLPLALGGSVHLTTDPPVTQAVTRVFPSWLEAFETVKHEPPEIIDQEVPPMVIPNPRNMTWKQYGTKLSAQLWRLLNYVHQVNEAPPAARVFEPPTIYGTPDPVTGYYWVPEAEYDYYRRLKPNGKGPTSDLIRPISMKKEIEEQHRAVQRQQAAHEDEEIKTVMKWVETGAISPTTNGEATEAPSLRGATKSEADKTISA